MSHTKHEYTAADFRADVIASIAGTLERAGHAPDEARVMAEISYADNFENLDAQIALGAIRESSRADEKSRGTEVTQRSAPALVLTDADYAAIVKRYEDAGDVQNADIIRRQWEVARAGNTPRDKLLTIIAAAYQVAGAHNVPAHILDVLANPEVATNAQVDAMLPYVPTSPGQASASQIDTRRDDPLITVGFNDLMTLARSLIAEQIHDCDEEFMAGRAHGVGSFHSEILELSKRTAPALVQDAPKSAGAQETIRSSEKAQVSPTPMCERKTDDIIQRDGYRKTGYVLQRTTADRVCISDGGAVAWFTREEWRWLLFNRDHVEFQWTKPISAKPAPANLRMRAELAEDVLATVLWLYRRLPRSYGRPPTVERPILALAQLTGIDVDDCLAERGEVDDA